MAGNVEEQSVRVEGRSGGEEEGSGEREQKSKGWSDRTAYHLRDSRMEARAAR